MAKIYLFIYCLQEGSYRQQEKSKVLPILSKSVILQFLSRRGVIGENALLSEFRQWLQKQEINEKYKFLKYISNYAETGFIDENARFNI